MFQRCIVAPSTDSVGRASHYALRMPQNLPIVGS